MDDETLETCLSRAAAQLRQEVRKNNASIGAKKPKAVDVDGYVSLVAAIFANLAENGELFVSHANELARSAGLSADHGAGGVNSTVRSMSECCRKFLIAEAELFAISPPPAFASLHGALKGVGESAVDLFEQFGKECCRAERPLSNGESSSINFVFEIRQVNNANAEIERVSHLFNR